ncbi:MAG TPA: zinc ribbon domain-containing protein [Anaerolineae bacterium]|nr:zinc ribbon domain-containing protein [Anaerolineae bacterium]HOR01297.1 zinc ribbon domain-containing protein [Anaerolineae bacterium]HPL27146.1 zinc ribbon domain-containing protein [Anaerolineae bacterium]
MADLYRRCVNCGASLVPGTRFCEACGRPAGVEGDAQAAHFCGRCGKPLKAGVSFCESCGAPLAGAPPYPPPPPPVAGPAYGPPPVATAAVAPRPQPATRGGSVIGKIVVILVGLLIAGFGLQGPLLEVAGATTLAAVTDVSPGEETGEYTIRYRFTPAGGTAVTGSVQRQAFNVATLPREGSTMRVRYLRIWPAINGPASGGLSPLASLGVIALGIVIIVLGFKFSWRISSGRGD